MIVHQGIRWSWPVVANARINVKPGGGGGGGRAKGGGDLTFPKKLFKSPTLGQRIWIKW